MHATYVTEDDAERDARMGSSTSAGRRVVFMQRATDGEAELACVGADQLWTRCAAVFDVEWRSLCHCEVGRSARGGAVSPAAIGWLGGFWGDDDPGGGWVAVQAFVILRGCFAPPTHLALTPSCWAARAALERWALVRCAGWLACAEAFLPWR